MYVSFGTKTEFISTVQGQCAPGAFTQAIGATSVIFGGENTGVLAPGHVAVVATPPSATNMNQLGTVYATKRRRRNGKRLVPVVFLNQCLPQFCYLIQYKWFRRYEHHKTGTLRRKELILTEVNAYLHFKTKACWTVGDLFTLKIFKFFKLKKIL